MWKHALQTNAQNFQHNLMWKIELNLNRHNIVYFSRCPNATCNETYVGETDRRIKERKGAKVHIY